MKLPKSFYIFVVLIVFLAIADLLLALKSSFLESNVAIAGLYTTLGPFLTWGIIIVLKFLLVIALIWVVGTQKYRTERYMFFVITLFAFMIIAQGYGTYTGVRGYLQVKDYEEEHGPFTLEAKDMIRIEVQGDSVKTYPTTTFWISIFPLVIANFSFYIFEKMYPSAKILKRRWKNSKD